MLQLETPRLLLRPFVPEDLAALRQTLGDPQVMYAWEHGFSDEEVAGWISRNRRRYAQEGMGYLAAVERQTGELVGTAAGGGGRLFGLYPAPGPMGQGAGPGGGCRLPGLRLPGIGGTPGGGGHPPGKPGLHPGGPGPGYGAGGTI